MAIAQRLLTDASYCLLLPTIARYCQLLPPIAYYCPLLPTYLLPLAMLFKYRWIKTICVNTYLVGVVRVNTRHANPHVARGRRARSHEGLRGRRRRRARSHVGRRWWRRHPLLNHMARHAHDNLLLLRTPAVRCARSCRSARGHRKHARGRERREADWTVGKRWAEIATEYVTSVGSKPSVTYVARSPVCEPCRTPDRRNHDGHISNRAATLVVTSRFEM